MSATITMIAIDSNGFMRDNHKPAAHSFASISNFSRNENCKQKQIIKKKHAILALKHIVIRELQNIV